MRFFALNQPATASRNNSCSSNNQRQFHSVRSKTRAVAAPLAMSGSSGGGSGGGSAGVACPRRKQLEEIASKCYDMFPEVPHLTAGELHTLLEDVSQSQNVVLVDVRLPEEVAVSVIPHPHPQGATLTTEAFEAQRAELAGKVVVAYCTIGYRSGKYAAQLRREGVDARNLAGSILAWTQEGFPLVVPPTPATAATQPAGSEAGEGAAEPQPTRRVHVFGKQWALQGEGYEPVMFNAPLLTYAASAVRKVLPSWLGGTR